MEIQEGVTIIICCYNSGWIIDRTLRQLGSLHFETIPDWEIVIVDNNSNDTTIEIVQQYIKAGNPESRIHLVKENTQGLSYARLKGISQARFDILVFCDDDNFLNENYIIKAFQLMKFHPEISLLGGIGEAVFESAPDPRILPFIEQYAVDKQSEDDFADITLSRGYVYGAGMILRKAVFNDLYNRGFRFYNTGRTADRLTGSEDVELGNALRLAGYKIYYSSDLQFQHYLKTNRLSWNYLKRMNFGTGFSSVMMIQYSFQRNRPSWKSNFLYVFFWFFFNHFKISVLRIFKFRNDPIILDYEKSRGAIRALLISPKQVHRNIKDYKFRKLTLINEAAF